MKITITAPGQNVQPVSLYDSSWPNAWISNQQPGLDAEKQKDVLFGSNFPYLKYRGNDLFPRSFIVWRNVDDKGVKFTDGLAAADWFDSHLINVPREGVVDITRHQHYQLAYAILLPIRLNKQDGILLRINYQIEGTQLTLIG